MLNAVVCAEARVRLGYLCVARAKCTVGHVFELVRSRSTAASEMWQRRIAAVQNSSHQLRRLSPDPRIKVRGNARDASGGGAPPIRRASDFGLGRLRERSTSQDAYSAPSVKSGDGQRRNVSSIASFPRKDGRRYPQTDRNVVLRESSCESCGDSIRGKAEAGKGRRE